MHVELFSPLLPSLATPGPPLPYRPLQNARYYYPGFKVGSRAARHAVAHLRVSRHTNTQASGHANMQACERDGRRWSGGRQRDGERQREPQLLRESMRWERTARSARTYGLETASVAAEGKEEKRHFRQSHCHDPEMNAEAEGGKLSSQIKTDGVHGVDVLAQDPARSTSAYSTRLSDWLGICCRLQLSTPLSPSSPYSNAALS